jgi:hypothetical protein
MDPAALYPIFIPVASITIMVTLTGFCCIRSMITRNTTDLHARIAEVEQRLQCQIQQIHTTSPGTSCASTPLQQPIQAYYYNQPPPYYTIANYA